MEKIVRQLDDLKHSQQAVLEKIANIEVENIELGDKNLENILPEIHQRTANNLDAISGLLDDFAQKTETFANQNNVNSLKEQEEIKNIK